jgi:hypothetical protein
MIVSGTPTLIRTPEMIIGMRRISPVVPGDTMGFIPN